MIRFFRLMYIKLFRINDSPQKIALGFGLGIFLGILPGTGPLAALFLALLFRVNRASALLGALLTNTWLSIVSFLFSIKIGSAIMGIDWRQVYAASTQTLKNFHWNDVLKISVLKIFLPILLGYIAVAFCLALVSYIVILTLLIIVKPAVKKGKRV